jgi:hypothetical protein
VILKEHSGSASPAKTNSNPLDTSFHVLVNRGPDVGLGVSLDPPEVLLLFLEKEIFASVARRNFCPTESTSCVRIAPSEVSVGCD